MINYISSFCDEFSYPEEAKNTFATAYKNIIDNQMANQLFSSNLEKFYNNEFSEGEQVLELLNQVSQLTGVHKYTIHLLFYICLSKNTRILYEERKIPYSVFFDSMSDLKWKLFECHNMYEIWGSFVASWFFRFFDLTRFALGRLQFEPFNFPLEYEKNGYVLHKGDMVLNIHIPSCGPLTEEACENSYIMAKEFFKDEFVGKPTAFMCDSWLLYTEHTKFLPKNSNILNFMNNFDIIKCTEEEGFSNAWRVFYVNYSGNSSVLPQNTSLQKAYSKWLEKENKAGHGLGVMFR